MTRELFYTVYPKAVCDVCGYEDSCKIEVHDDEELKSHPKWQKYISNPHVRSIIKHNVCVDCHNKKPSLMSRIVRYFDNPVFAGMLSYCILRRFTK